MLKKIFLLLFFFTLIYKPEFIFIPHSVNMFFGILGLFFFLFKSECKMQLRNESTIMLRSIVKYIIPFVSVSVFSIILNGSYDFYYPRYAISLVLCFFAMYLFAFCFYNVYGCVSVEKIIDYFIVAECLFLFIGLLSYFTPELFNALKNLQKYNEIALMAMDRTEGSRLISIGAQFFSAAVINGYVLLIIGLGFYSFRMSVLKKSLYILAFIYILVVGMMMGRTTIIGGVIGFSLMMLSFTQRLGSSIKTFVAMGISLLLAYLLFTVFVSSASWNFDTLRDFGFEMFDNYQNGKDLSVHSNERLWSMYNTIPQDFGTWIVGDAKWDEENHYYMRVDPGYLRGLWYFGIAGLVALFVYYYKIIDYVVAKKRTFNGKILIPSIALCLYVLILNTKGPMDLFFYLIPFAFCNKCQECVSAKKILIFGERKYENKRSKFYI